MDKQDAKKRIEKLKKEIDHHRYQYHVLDKQEISDAALDSLKHELFLLEQEYPDLITPDSPTQRVAGKALRAFGKVTHSYRMMSLQDMFSSDELKDWEQRNSKLLPGKEFTYYCELKIDGLAISLRYQDGFLKLGATRGDGYIGEDVTQNLKTIESIPLCIPTKEDIEIRGEVYMLKKEFEEVNAKRAKEGKVLYANPRNLAAGSIRQLDPQVTASRQLCFYAYDMRNHFIGTHHEVHERLVKLGFKTEKHSKLCSSLDEAIEFCNSWADKRASMPYQVDGVVITIDSEKTHETLGVVGKAPRFACAYKFPAEEATTIIEDIQLQVGRTGALTPVAHLRPIAVAGSTVSRATLHNYDEIERLDVRIGDTVIVHKAGDIIPEVIDVLKGMRTGKEKKFSMPLVCPMCGSLISRKGTSVAYYCSNKNCFATIHEQIVHFVSKKGFNIRGLGTKIIEQLLLKKIIKDAADIFILETGDVIDLEGFAQRSSEKLIAEIRKSKEIDLGKFIFALGIRYIGQETSHDLARFITKETPDITDPEKLVHFLRKRSQEFYEEIKGIGKKASESLLEFFNNSHTRDFCKRLTLHGINFKHSYVAKENTTSIFTNKRFIMTGSFEFMTRDQVYDAIRERGGQIASSVSESIDYVIVGDKPGSKLQKAEKLGIRVVREKEFLKWTMDF